MYVSPPPEPLFNVELCVLQAFQTHLLHIIACKIIFYNRLWKKILSLLRLKFLNSVFEVSPPVGVLRCPVFFVVCVFAGVLCVFVFAATVFVFSVYGVCD